MKMTKVLAASAAVAALAVGAPAMAQQNQGNDVYDNADSLVINDLLDIYLAQDASTTNTLDDINSNNNNNNDLVVATQTLTAYNTNSQMDELIDLDGEDGTPAPVGYNSGDNYVRGNAFAAFAGILNQSWNTGVNNNNQAATNIAAQGSINFGDGAGEAAAGGGGGD
ncbi:hypothetical protein [Parasphingorhabdus sp.]|jgi:hypothetical protein|uniref:hypothetical protein n=1 Tax=Parasphingorhabdus sp. TaxID=2709688 RepID=UPI003BAE5377